MKHLEINLGPYISMSLKLFKITDKQGFNGSINHKRINRLALYFIITFPFFNFLNLEKTYLFCYYYFNNLNFY